MVRFNAPSFQMYYQSVDRIVTARLDREDPDYLARVDAEQYLDFLASEIEWQPLEWDESAMTVEPFTARVRHESPYGGEYVTETQRFRLRIPTASHPQRREYLDQRPREMRSTGEPDWHFEGDTLVIEVDATQAAVEKALDEVRYWFGGRNKDIQEGNATLRERIRPVWEGRRRRLEEQYQGARAELEKLNIPLYRNLNARAKPVELKPRVIRTIIEKPAPKERKKEPFLQRENVLGLVDFIEQYVRQFEVMPKTYAKMDEEELRDHVVAMMNASYPGSTTAETFNKLGKTDIRLRVDGGNVLICECKIWSGPKAYSGALEQLFGYLTWRENYGVLVTFCKGKDMSAAIAHAKQAVQGHATFVAGSLADQSSSRFSTRHRHPQDAGKSVEVFHIFTDLSM